MLPVPNIEIHIEHSCNWRCCWGCKCTGESESERFERLKRELDKAYEAAQKVLYLPDIKRKKT